MVADKVWVLDIRDQVFALGSIRVFDARVNRKVHRNQISVNLVVEALPRCFGRPVCIRRAPPAKGLLAKRQGGESGTNAVRPDLFKNVLRSMTLKSSLTQRKRVLTKVAAILSFGADHGLFGNNSIPLCIAFPN